VEVSSLASEIKTSPTLSLNEKARLLREKGEPVIHLGIGEPINMAPISAIKRSRELLKTRNIKYGPTCGLPSLKQAIINFTEENYERQILQKNIIVSTGAKQSLFNTLLSIVNPQDQIMLLAPYWVSYPEIIKLVHGVPMIVQPKPGTFQPRVEDIKDATTPRLKAIILNSPNNPSGHIYSNKFMAELVEYCERSGIYLIVDDIYQKLVSDGKQPIPAYHFTKESVDSSRIIVINGISKQYGMTGFRVGWVVASSKLVHVMAKIQSQTTSCASLVSQAAAEGALSGSQDVVEELRQSIDNNRKLMIQHLGALNQVKFIPPEGALFCFPDFSAYDTDSIRLTNFILEKALVITVPGIGFGMEGHIRLSYAGSSLDIIEGIKRIRWALDPDADNEITIGEKRVFRDWL
jgi:aspartate aminotransferase